MKKFFIIILLFFAISSYAYSSPGFFLGFKTGLYLKVDVASGFNSKRIIDPDMNIDNSIIHGIGEYGMADSHGFPRIIEPLSGVYGDLQFLWGYRFKKLFSLGFSILLSQFVMPYLTIDAKFSFREDKKVQPYVFISIYGGLLDGFPIGITGGGGIDIYFNDHFFLLAEIKTGAEIFVRNYYDDGNNSNPIWHFETTYAYAAIGFYVGIGYKFGKIFKKKNAIDMTIKL